MHLATCWQLEFVCLVGQFLVDRKRANKSRHEFGSAVARKQLLQETVGHAICRQQDQITGLELFNVASTMTVRISFLAILLCRECVADMLQDGITFIKEVTELAQCPIRLVRDRQTRW